tara:strand:- start:441 stop:1037 length:597 start_codon:yes stop_codon:yes gene_type:complete
MESKIKNQLKSQISSSIEVKHKLLQDENFHSKIISASNKIIDSFRSGKKLLLAGNGGSAADAQHISAEFVSRFYFDRPGLPSIALTTDSSIITAIGNDYGYDKLFERQIDAIGAEGDVFLGISTSGNSVNILKAFKLAKEKNIFTIGFSGENGIKDFTPDILFNIPSVETPRIQESHILTGHLICYLVEELMFGNDNA